ncbi:MAG: NAD-dependent epimerase/dehydratase family protein [Acholeplasma sp.]|jgi:dihydroflavonol-4-reductase|nr:NAD-dependent epimerase/dehydratase family protein [Acholeplasma sp.]
MVFIVTGASGHIGNQVVRTLLQQGYEVKVLARNPLSQFQGKAVVVTLGDLTDPDFLNREIRIGDIVIHAVGYIDLHNSNYDHSVESNLTTAQIMADVCKDRGARLVYISTADIIDKADEGIIEEPVTFKTIDPSDHYAYTKKEATLYVRKTIKSGLSGVILYPTAVIGANDYKLGPISKEIQSVLKKRILFSLSGGYNFIDVEDLSKAIIQSGFLPYNDEFILSGFNLSITDLYKRIRNFTKQKKIIVHVPLWLVRKLIGFNKQYSMKMIDVVTENHKYSNQKMKKALLSELKPFDLTLAETIRFVQTKR